MKSAKIIAFVAICLLTSCVLFGCSDNDTPETVWESTSNIQTAENSEYEYIFNEVPGEGNEIEEYRKEYKNRIETSTLKREDEIEFLENNGYFIYTDGGYFRLSYFDEHNGWTKTYFDPIVYQSDNGYEVLAINNQGELCSITTEDGGVYIIDEEMRVHVDTMVYHDVKYYGTIHYTAKEGEEIIESDEYRVISYQPTTGMVKYWEYGELTGQIEVPANSIYVGYAYWNGYLFKDGTDVWVVREDFDNNGKTKVAEIIAHNVEFVITTQYDVGRGVEEPLFLMTDGTLKTYSRYNCEYEVPIDDESHLIDLQY